MNWLCKIFGHRFEREVYVQPAYVPIKGRRNGTRKAVRKFDYIRYRRCKRCGRFVEIKEKKR